MIGFFDSGPGGLALVREFSRANPGLRVAYLSDHAGPPYGSAPADRIIERTRQGVEALFLRGCRLVVIASNTAAAVALHRLQRNWLPGAGWAGRNVLGVIVPSAEEALAAVLDADGPGQQPDVPGRPLVTSAQPQFVGVIGATRTIASGAYRQEFAKLAPRLQVVQQISFNLATAIEDDAGPSELRAHVEHVCEALMRQLRGGEPAAVVLAASSFDFVAPLFHACLPESARLIRQPEAVIRRLRRYLDVYPHYADGDAPPADGAGLSKGQRRIAGGQPRGGGATENTNPLLLTTADPEEATQRARTLWPAAPAFSVVSLG